MTIEQVREILTDVANDKAGDCSLVARTVGQFILDSTDGYEDQYGDEDKPNEVVASWLDDFDDVIEHLRLKLLGLTSVKHHEGFDYWGEHPDYPLADWRYECDNNDTRQGYWEWVDNRIAAAEDTDSEDDADD